MPRLLVTRVARADLREIGQFSVERFGGSAARGYLVGLRQRLHAIADRPLVGRPEPDLGEGARSAPYRTHRIYYRVVGDELRVIRVLHQSRDRTTAEFDDSQ